MSRWNAAPYIKGKNFVPDPISRYGIPKYADSKQNPKVKGTLDWQKFWEEQLYYIHNGYETGGMWIPGRYYYFMNYRIFNTVLGPIRPQMLDLHLELAYIIEFCKTNGKNFVGPKGRRLGLSEAGQTMVVDYGFRFFPGYKAGIAAGQQIYIDDFMQKWQDANALVVPEFKIKTLVNNSDETVAGYKFKDNEGNVIEDGTKNIIYKRTMYNNPHLFKGLYMNDIVAEEMGEFEHAKDFYSASIDCLMFGAEQKGSMFCYGTGGSMGDSSDAFEDMWHNHESYNAVRMFIPRTKFFFPYYGGATEDGVLKEKVPNLLHLKPYERIGIPDEEAAKEYILAERARLLASGDMDKYYDFCKNTPLDITEVFKKTVSNSFDIEKLNAQGHLIGSNPKKYGKWKLEWKKNSIGEIVFPREVIARPANNDDLEEDCVLILHDGHPVKGYRSLFVGGVDSYDQDKSKTSKSLGSMVVRRKSNQNPVLLNRQVVCLVRTRPKRKEIFYETCEKVSVYYGLHGNTLIDYAKPGIIQHYKDSGLESYLAKRPQKFEGASSTQGHDYGVSLNTYSRPMMVSLLQSYILDYSDSLWFDIVIDEALIFDEFTKDSDNDSIDALGISLMQEVSDSVTPFNQDDKELNDAYAYPEFETDSDGDIVQVSKGDKDRDVFESGMKMSKGSDFDYPNESDDY